MKPIENIFKFGSLVLLLGVLAFEMSAAPVDDARRLVNDGRYEEAVPLLRKIVKSRPRDAVANYLLGYSLLESGDTAGGIRYLGIAEARGSLDAAALLARHSFDSYEPDEAQEHLDAWVSSARKAKKTLPDNYDVLSSRLVAMENMLQRVEKIEIIDTLHVDSVGFFSHYRLSAHAGSLAPGDALVSQAGASVVFVPERRSEMFWAAEDSTGHSAVFSSSILDDGTVENPEKAELADGGNASFPFLMPDGMTLYYAADDGPEGLGGYDIYMTRRNDDGSYMQSQNIGMPYNSPFNDFMLAVDETTGLGWWASDREQIPGMVTVYVYAPSETRVNYDPGTENLPELARLSDISLTQNPEKDYKAELESRLAGISVEPSGLPSSVAPSFEIDMGTGRIYTSLDDFRSEDARRTMLRCLAGEVELRRNLDRLASMREEYSAKPSENLGRRILELEDQIGQARRSLRSLRNTAVRLETRE